MPDPLSIVVSISGVAAVGTEALAQLYLFIRGIRYASDNIQNLARELQDLCTVLEKLEKNFSTGVRHKELWLDLKEVLHSCKNLFLRLRGIVKAHRIKRDDGWFLRQWKRGKWTLQEKEVTYLRSQLEAHKATLKITLLLSAHTETTSVKDTTDRIEEAVREVIDRLIQLGDGEDTVATYASSFILQRYLSSANSVFSSPPSSPTKDVQLNFKGITEGAEGQQIKVTDTTGQERVKRKASAGIFGGLKEDLSKEFYESQPRSEKVPKVDNEGIEEDEGFQIEELRTEEFDRKTSEQLQPERREEVDKEIARIETEANRLLRRATGGQIDEKTDAGTVMPCEDTSKKLRKLQLQLVQVQAETDKLKNEEEDIQPPSYEDTNEKGAGGAEIELKSNMQTLTNHKRPKYEIMNQKRRTYTRFSKAHLCKEALDEQKIAYTEKPEYFLVHRVVDKTEQNHLWARTKEIRNGHKEIEETKDAAENTAAIPGPPNNACVKYVQIGGFIFVKQ